MIRVAEVVLVVLVAGFVAGCGGSSSPTQPTSVSAAQVPLNDHNCAGSTTTIFVGALGGAGFGDAVSDAGQAQLVDNFGSANCGAPPRQNP